VQNASSKTTATTVGHIMGGTGRLVGIQGVVRSVIGIDPRPGGHRAMPSTESSTRSANELAQSGVIAAAHVFAVTKLRY
jgi:hypothetical protein